MKKVSYLFTVILAAFMLASCNHSLTKDVVISTKITQDGGPRAIADSGVLSIVAELYAGEEAADTKIAKKTITFDRAKENASITFGAGDLDAGKELNEGNKGKLKVSVFRNNVLKFTGESEEKVLVANNNQLNVTLKAVTDELYNKDITISATSVETGKDAKGNAEYYILVNADYNVANVSYVKFLYDDVAKFNTKETNVVSKPTSNDNATYKTELAAFQEFVKKVGLPADENTYSVKVECYDENGKLLAWNEKDVLAKAAVN